ncbi:MAG: DNA gyrase subunit A, partial [Alphaproteobacteria bacterium]|nr:DNA gyrase subunit A [Alphaproteobacteria bacterium]
YEDIDDEDLIQQEDMVITYTTDGYIKRVPLGNYRMQKRGGRGKNCMNTKDNDLVKDVIIANTHDEILCFSTIGKVYKMNVYKLPLCNSESSGRALVNVLPLDENEKLSNILVLQNDNDLANKTLVFITSFGNVRRNKFSDFFNIQSNGKRAIKLEGNETLVNILLANEDDDLFIATKNGLCNRFPVSSIRVFASRDSNGIRGIKLKENDKVISASLLYKSDIESIEEREEYFKIASELRSNINKLNPNTRMSKLAMAERFILTVTSKGFGQLSSFYDYRQISRGTQGCQNMTLSSKNGTVVASFPVNRDDQIMLLTNTGRILRCSVSEIRITRRGAKGVILFRLNDDISNNETEELVTSVSRIDASISEEERINNVENSITASNDEDVQNNNKQNTVNMSNIEEDKNNNFKKLTNTSNIKEEPLVSEVEDDDSLDDIFGNNT